MSPAVATFPSEADAEIDFIEEIRLRTWARKNYAPATDRMNEWHPVVLDEMTKMDREN